MCTEFSRAVLQVRTVRKKTKSGKEEFIRLEVKLLNGADLVLELVRTSVGCCRANVSLIVRKSCKSLKEAVHAVLLAKFAHTLSDVGHNHLAAPKQVQSSRDTRCVCLNDSEGTTRSMIKQQHASQLTACACTCCQLAGMLLLYHATSCPFTVV